MSQVRAADNPAPPAWAMRVLVAWECHDSVHLNLLASLKTKGVWHLNEREVIIFCGWEHCSQGKRHKLLLILPFSIGSWVYKYWAESWLLWAFRSKGAFTWFYKLSIRVGVSAGQRVIQDEDFLLQHNSSRLGRKDGQEQSLSVNSGLLFLQASKKEMGEWNPTVGK